MRAQDSGHSTLFNLLLAQLMVTSVVCVCVIGCDSVCVCVCVRVCVCVCVGVRLLLLDPLRKCSVLLAGHDTEKHRT